MKIGVNAAPLLKPFTGIGQYTRNLFSELARLDSENEYILVMHDDLPKDLLRIFSSNVGVKIVREKRFPVAGMRKTWWEQISLPETLLKEGVDIAFFPYPSNPWTRDWYRGGESGCDRGHSSDHGTIKTVVTVHDCIPWTQHGYAHGPLSKLYHAQTRKAVKMADLIFTVSEHSKKEIVRVCGADAKKVEVAYNDASEVYKQAIDKDFAAKVLKEFGLTNDDFFLYCGGYDERKNVNYLVEEYLNSGVSKPLVLVGQKLFNSKLYKSFDKFGDGRNGGVGGKIIKPGFLTEKQLAVLYSNCAAFIHMSREEGFNIPVIEAANCGAALILSDIPVHREIAGDAATFVDINKKSTLTEILRSGKFKSSKGVAEKYSWKISAQKVKKQLEKLSS